MPNATRDVSLLHARFGRTLFTRIADQVVILA